MVVATHLGIDADQLAGPISLSDDLAVDSLDRLELVIALEDELGIRVPEDSIDTMRTYADLVAVIRSHVRARDGRGPDGVPVQAHVQRGDGSRLLRSGVLTRYMVETIADDLLPRGPLAHLELTLAWDAADGEAAWVTEQFAVLRRRGIPVTVRRGTAAPRPRDGQAGARLGHG